MHDINWQTETVWPPHVKNDHKSFSICKWLLCIYNLLSLVPWTITLCMCKFNNYTSASSGQVLLMIMKILNHCKFLSRTVSRNNIMHALANCAYTKLFLHADWLQNHFTTMPSWIDGSHSVQCHVSLWVKWKLKPDTSAGVLVPDTWRCCKNLS